jgi:ribosome biogenesis protein SSF1/2
MTLKIKKKTFLNVSEHFIWPNYDFVAFVIKRGKVGVYLKELLKDTRNVLYPYTATKLAESKKNSIKDFVAAAGTFGVSHMLVYT